MKKVSTVAAKPSKKISQQNLTVGLDLGDRNSWYCVLDESVEIQLEQRVRTNAKALQEVFGAMPHSRIALEIGDAFALDQSLAQRVRACGDRGEGAQGAADRQSRKKDDRLDAQTLGGWPGSILSCYIRGSIAAYRPKPIS